MTDIRHRGSHGRMAGKRKNGRSEPGSPGGFVLLTEDEPLEIPEKEDKKLTEYREAPASPSASTDTNERSPFENLESPPSPPTFSQADNERLPNELLDEICSDMGIKDSMDLDFVDFLMDQDVPQRVPAMRNAPPGGKGKTICQPQYNPDGNYSVGMGFGSGGPNTAFHRPGMQHQQQQHGKHMQPQQHNHPHWQQQPNPQMFRAPTKNMPPRPGMPGSSSAFYPAGGSDYRMMGPRPMSGPRPNPQCGYSMAGTGYSQSAPKTIPSNGQGNAPAVASGNSSASGSPVSKRIHLAPPSGPGSPNKDQPTSTTEASDTHVSASSAPATSVSQTGLNIVTSTISSSERKSPIDMMPMSPAHFKVPQMPSKSSTDENMCHSVQPKTEQSGRNSVPLSSSALTSRSVPSSPSSSSSSSSYPHSQPQTPSKVPISSSTGLQTSLPAQAIQSPRSQRYLAGDNKTIQQQQPSSSMSEKEPPPLHHIQQAGYQQQRPQQQNQQFQGHHPPQSGQHADMMYRGHAQPAGTGYQRGNRPTPPPVINVMNMQPHARHPGPNSALPRWMAPIGASSTNSNSQHLYGPNSIYNQNCSDNLKSAMSMMSNQAMREQHHQQQQHPQQQQGSSYNTMMQSPRSIESPRDAGYISGDTGSVRSFSSSSSATGNTVLCAPGAGMVRNVGGGSGQMAPMSMHSPVIKSEKPAEIPPFQRSHSLDSGNAYSNNNNLYGTQHSGKHGAMQRHCMNNNNVDYNNFPNQPDDAFLPPDMDNEAMCPYDGFPQGRDADCDFNGNDQKSVPNKMLARHMQYNKPGVAPYIVPNSAGQMPVTVYDIQTSNNGPLNMHSNMANEGSVACMDNPELSSYPGMMGGHNPDYCPPHSGLGGDPSYNIPPHIDTDLSCAKSDTYYANHMDNNMMPPPSQKGMMGSDGMPPPNMPQSAHIGPGGLPVPSQQQFNLCNSQSANEMPPPQSSMNPFMEDSNTIGSVPGTLCSGIPSHLPASMTSTPGSNYATPVPGTPNRTYSTMPNTPVASTPTAPNWNGPHGMQGPNQCNMPGGMSDHGEMMPHGQMLPPPYNKMPGPQQHSPGGHSGYPPMSGCQGMQPPQQQQGMNMPPGNFQCGQTPESGCGAPDCIDCQNQQRPPPAVSSKQLFIQHLITDRSNNAFRSHPLFPLLRDLIIADMNFNSPSFPYQLIINLPGDFEKLLQNFLQRNPPAGNYQNNYAVESVIMDALKYAHHCLIGKIQSRREQDKHTKSTSKSLSAIEEFCEKFDRAVRNTFTAPDGSQEPVSSGGGGMVNGGEGLVMIGGNCNPLEMTPTKRYGMEMPPPSMFGLSPMKKGFDIGIHDFPPIQMLPDSSSETGSMSSASNHSGKAESKKHPSLPKEAVAVMLEWLRNHKDNPYPNDDEKAMLIKTTGLTINQINYWFTNARRRILPKWAQCKS